MEKSIGLILGVSGHARSGKDSFANMLANILKEKTGKDYSLIAYAGELKRQIAEHFDLSYGQLYGGSKETEDERYSKPDGSGCWTPREIMQSYGQFMREIDYDYWVKILFKRLEQHCITNAIITDLRHINEVDAVHDRGGVHIRIHRDSDECKNVYNPNHISETALDNYGHIDFEVNNNWTLKELKVSATELAEIIKEKYKEELHDG